MINSIKDSMDIKDMEENKPLQTIQTIDLPVLDNSNISSTGKSVLSDFNPIHAVKTKLQVSLGELELTVGELMHAKEHQIFKMNRDVHQPIDLLLEGHVVARGHLVAIDGHFAIKISEIPNSLKA